MSTNKCDFQCRYLHDWIPKEGPPTRTYTPISWYLLQEKIPPYNHRHLNLADFNHSRHFKLADFSHSMHYNLQIILTSLSRIKIIFFSFIIYYLYYCLYKNTTHDICHEIFTYDVWWKRKNSKPQTNSSTKYISNIDPVAQIGVYTVCLICTWYVF